MHRLTLWAILLMGLPISSDAGQQFSGITVRSVTVAERGADEAGSFCEDFELKPAEVTSFLRKARIVDARTIHDNYDRLPCYVRGKANWPKHGEVAWEIRAGGTGTLKLRNGQTLLLGCRQCADQFGKGNKSR